MKKAGKNSPAPTSSGKEPLKEEVKASNHLETEEDSNVAVRFDVSFFYNF